MSALYNEIEPYAAEWLRALERERHIAAGAVDGRSIADLSPADIAGYTQFHAFAGVGAWSYALRLAGWPDDVPVWTGSCPCQPFSQAGRRRGTADARHTWPEWFRLIRKCRTSVVFGEQVASPDGRRWLDAVLADLEEVGFAVGAADLCAAGVGAPHIRQRLYFVAHSPEARWPGWWGSGRTALPQEVAEEPRRHDDARGMADASEGRLAQGHTDNRRGNSGSAAQLDGTGSTHDGASVRLLSDTDGTRPQERPGPEERFGAVRHEGPTTAQAGATRGAWADAEWWACRDGLVRPAKPGSFPLAHGAPARVGRLRAYGNAINPQVAATFIRAAAGGWRCGQER